jgi:hypothetical protein
VQKKIEPGEDGRGIGITFRLYEFSDYFELAAKTAERLGPRQQ